MVEEVQQGPVLVETLIMATNSCRPDVRVRARRVPCPCRLRAAAVRMD